MDAKARENAMQEPDESLYLRYMEQRREADFRILFERHKESLTLFLFGYVHNMEDAEELMMDAYAQVAAGSGFAGRSSFKTWLFAIGKNLALQKIRKRHVETVELTEEAGEGPDTPEFEILKHERSMRLYQAMNCLNPEYRQTLYLLYFEEMSCEEVARVMKKTRKQVYNLAERSRKAMSEELRKRGFEDEF